MMTDLYKFMSDSPWLVAFFVCLIYYLLKLSFWIIQLLIRHLNIRKQGWPPSYLDADGDYKRMEEDNDD